jgi:O-antigen/teichoic acid export membrane protein
VREKELTAALRATAFTVNLLLALGLAVVIAGVGFAGAAWLAEAGVRRVLVVLAAVPLIEAIAFQPGALLERSGRFKEISLASTASVIIGTVSMIALAMLGFSYMSVAYAQCIRVATNALLLNVIGREHVRFRLGIVAWRRVAYFSVQMLAVSGITALSARLSEIVLARLLGLAALGIFSRASGINNLMTSNVHLVVARVVFVDYADRHRQGESLRQRYLQTIAVATALLWPAFAGSAILAGPLILRIYGSPWLPAAPALALLSLASIIRVAITMSWELFAVTGNLAAQTRIEYVRAISWLAVFAAACTFGVTAAAGASIVDASLAFVLYRRHLDRMTETNLTDLMPIYLRSAVVTVLGILPAASLMAAYRWSPSVPWPLALGAVLLGIALWAAGLTRLGHPLVPELVSLLKRFGWPGFIAGAPVRDAGAADGGRLK